MKHILLSFLILLPCFAWAQAIPNGSFETWVRNPSSADTTDKIPDTWQGFGLPGALTRLSPAQSGAFAMRIKAGDLGGIPFPMLLLNNFAIPQTYRYLNGYVRKIAGAGDTLSINCVLYSTITSAVAGGYEQKITLAAQWTPFSIELASVSSIQADSAAIVIQVAGVGSGFDLDNFSFSNSAIGGPLATHSKLNNGGLSASIYPNPIADKTATLSISKLLGNSPLRVRIVDIVGMTVWTETHSASTASENITLSTEMLKKGMYRVVVENAGRKIVLPFVKN